MLERGRLFEIVRFLAAGLTTTVFSYALYLALLLKMSYMPAYVASYIAGIVFSYFINTYFVFSEGFSLRSMLKFPLVYVAQFAINFMVIWLTVEKFEVRKELAPLIAIVLSIPVTYVMSRAIIKKGSRPGNQPD